MNICFFFQIGQPQVAEILPPQQPQAADISMSVSSNTPHDTQQSDHMITSGITTGGSELATAANNIEQTVPNEMDSIDPNITQNIANLTADIGEEVDNENNVDSDIDDDMNEKNENHDSDDEYQGMVHESVGEDMPHDTLGQDSLGQFDSVAVMPPSSSLNQLGMGNRNYHCSVSVYHLIKKTFKGNRCLRKFLLLFLFCF